MMNVTSLFPTQIYRDEQPEFVQKTILHTQSYFDVAQAEHRENPYKAIFQTRSMVKDSGLSFLTDYLTNSCINILQKQGYRTDSYAFSVSGLWGHLVCKGGVHLPHIHPNSQLSGFVFLEANNTSCFPMFSDPRPAKLMMDLQVQNSVKVYASTRQVIFKDIFPGSVMIFNSWLTHEFTSNMSDVPTKFIHFFVTHKLKDGLSQDSLYQT